MSATAPSVSVPTTASTVPTVPTVPAAQRTARARRRKAFVRVTRRHRRASIRRPITAATATATATTNATNATVTATSYGHGRAVAVRARRRRRVRAFFDRRRVGRRYSGGSDSGNAGVVASRTTPSSGA